MCFQVHLKSTGSVQSTLGFDHPGILVWQLWNNPRGSRDKNSFCWCLFKYTASRSRGWTNMVNFTQSWWWSISPLMHDHVLPVHLYVHSITTSKYISGCTPSQPPSFLPNWLNECFQVKLNDYTIRASNCISEVVWSWLPSLSPSSHHSGLQAQLWVH